MSAMRLIYGNEKGMVLPVGLIFLAIIALLGTTAVIVTTTDLKIGSNYRASQQAFYDAEAGVQYAIGMIENDLDTLDFSSSSVPVNYPPPAGFSFDTITTLTQVGTTSNYSFQVTGHSDSGDARKVIETFVRLTYPTPFTFGVFADEETSIGHHVKVDSYNSKNGSYADTVGSNGDIGTNSIDDDAIEIGNDAVIDGDAAVGPGGDPNEVIDDPDGGITGDKDPLDKKKDMTALTIPAGISLTQDKEIEKHESETWTTGTYAFDELSLSDHASLTLNGDITIYVSEFDIAHHATINITAGSSLTIYVTDEFEMDHHGLINASQKPENLLIYGTEDCDEISISHQADLYAAIYAPEAEIEIAHQATIYGSVVGKEVEIEHHGTVHYDEALADIQLLGGTPDGIVPVSWREVY